MVHFLEQVSRYGARERLEILFVQRGDLGRIGNRVSWQAGIALRQERIARGCGERLVAREHANHDRGELARVDLVALEYQRRMAEPRLRSARLTKINPPDLTAPYQRFFRVKAPRTMALVRRRAAAAPGSSPGWPPRSIARFHASVGSSDGPWLSKNSRAARAKKALRESFSALARASISRKRSSGSEIAVFMIVSMTGNTLGRKRVTERSPRGGRSFAVLQTRISSPADIDEIHAQISEHVDFCAPLPRPTIRSHP